MVSSILLWNRKIKKTAKKKKERKENVEWLLRFYIILFHSVSWCWYQTNFHSNFSYSQDVWFNLLFHSMSLHWDLHKWTMRITVYVYVYVKVVPFMFFTTLLLLLLFFFLLLFHSNIKNICGNDMVFSLGSTIILGDKCIRMNEFIINDISFVLDTA